LWRRPYPDGTGLNTLLGDCAARRYLFIPVDDMWVMFLFWPGIFATHCPNAPAVLLPTRLLAVFKEADMTTLKDM
jgi:hypothetical protein